MPSETVTTYKRKSNVIPSYKSKRSKAFSRIPRSIAYNGINKITRVASTAMPWVLTPSAGYSIGASYYQNFGLSFSPTGFSVVGSSVNYANINWPNASELSGLYDQIKLDKVEVWFHITTSPPAQGQTVGTFPLGEPLLYVATDVNDLGSSPSVEQTEQQEKFQMMNFRDGLTKKYVCRPKYQQLVTYTTLASATAARTGFVTSNLDIPHYGMRVSVPVPSTIGQHYLGIHCKLFCTLKNVK